MRLGQGGETGSIITINLLGTMTPNHDSCLAACWVGVKKGRTYLTRICLFNFVARSPASGFLGGDS